MRNMKKLLQTVMKKSVLLGLVGVVFLQGCAGSVSTETQLQNQMEVSQRGASEEHPITFTDDLGRSVTVKSCKRVGALIGSFADVWLTAGGTLVAAANDSWESLELDLGSDVVKTGTILAPNVEVLIAAQPDFVIASANTEADVALMSTLENAGIAVAYFDVSGFDAYLHMLDICTDLTGRKDLYQKNGLDVQNHIEEVKKRIDGSNPSVVFLRAASSNIKTKGSVGTVGGELLADLGCKNIADSDTSVLDTLSLEAIVKADPQYIFITIQGTNTEAVNAQIQKSLYDSPLWSSLTAVKEGRVYILEKRLYNLKPNARWGEAYEKVADILYPQK